MKSSFLYQTVMVFRSTMVVGLLLLSADQEHTLFVLGFCPSRLLHRASSQLAASITRQGNRGSPRNRKRQQKRQYSVQKQHNKDEQQQSRFQNKNEASSNEERLRAPINCQHFDTCPGCVVNDKVGSVNIIDSSKLYFSSSAVRRHRSDLIGVDATIAEHDDFYKVVVPSSLTGWRTQAKLAVAPKSSSWGRDGCSFGLYQRASHNVVSIPDCKVHHPSINKAVQELVDATSKVGTPAYDKSNGEGGLRYVQFQVDRTTGKICLTLVWNAHQLKHSQPGVSRLTKALLEAEPNLWHSMWCHCNDGVKNNIFSRNPNRWHLIWGPEFVREPIPSEDADEKNGLLYFTPSAFRQGNLDGFDVLALNVARAIPANSRVCELYAGVGVLGLTALSHHAQQGAPLQWLRCSDENPANPRCFKRAVTSMPQDVTGQSDKKNYRRRSDAEEKTSYLVASASEALYDGQAIGANVLIVDPPRKGLEPEVLAELCKPVSRDQDFVEDKSMLMIPDARVNWTNDVRTLVYVSCGFDALARDCDRLLASQGGWVLKSATGYILFPGSDHVETLCVFERR